MEINRKVAHATRLTSGFMLPVLMELGSCANQERKIPEHPNILIITTDQQSASMMSCAGNRWLKTPAMDAIASTGIRFNCAYATNPVCVPSRFSLQTGRFPSEIGMRENDRPGIDTARVQSLYSQSIGNLFQQAGYQTYYGGKVHLPVTGSSIKPWGFEPLILDERDSLAIVCSDFLMNRKKADKPFLLFASFINPHDICYDAIRWASPESGLAKSTPRELDEALKLPEGVSEEEFFEKYCPPLPDNHLPMADELSSVDSLVKLRPFRNIVREQWSEKDWRMHRWAYMRLTERVDAQIAIVMDALKRSGLSESTIVIFTSDHGDLDASHKLEHKTILYEEAARIPFIISYPWMKQKSIVDNEHLVSNGLDLLPTLCDFAGIQPPTGLMGRSVVPLTKQEGVADWPDHIFIETETGYMIHTGWFKYELDDIGKIREMFVDLKIDKGETKNRIDSPEYKNTIDSLRSKLINSLTTRGIPFNPPTILPGTDFALQSQSQAWMRHPVLGDPSFDDFKRYGNNPVQRGTPPFNWPVNGYYFEDPVTGNEYIFAGQYRTGYAMSTDKNTLDISKGCTVFCSEDKGKSWKYLGPAFKDESVMLEGQDGPVSIAPDVSVVYSEGKYFMGLDYVTNGFNWDIKNIINGGLAVAASDQPEGPYKISGKSAITNDFFYNSPWLGKYNRCYAGTLIKAKDQWLFLFDLDSGPYFSWGLAAMSAPSPEGPWSKPVLVVSCESNRYHPSLLEYFPVFQRKDTLYAPATSVAKNRNFQCIFRVAANEALNPEKWELWQEGSIWHSVNAENEYEGIWGQTYSGFINKDDELKVMYPSRDKENRGTINLASVDWNHLQRDSGFVLSGHGAPSFTAITGLYDQPDIESTFSYYGEVAFVWNYQAPVGPDRPKSDSELHPLMLSSHTRFQLTEKQWMLLYASTEGQMDTVSKGPIDKQELNSLRIKHLSRKTIISINNKVLWEGFLRNSGYGHCGLFAMKRSGVEVGSFIVSGKNHPGHFDWLYTEGLSNSGSNLKDWDLYENSSLFTYGIGAVSNIDTALAKWSFTGSGFDLYCPRLPDLGPAQIIVNGEIAGEINLHSGTPVKSAVVYSIRGLAQKKNAIIVKGKKGRISLDFLRVYE